MSIKTKKLNKAAKLGRKIDWWHFVAKIAKKLHDNAAKLNEKAMSKISDYTEEQNELIMEIYVMKTNFTDSKLNH